MKLCRFGDPGCQCLTGMPCPFAEGDEELCSTCRGPVPHECPVQELGDPVFHISPYFIPADPRSICIWDGALLDRDPPNHRRDCPAVTGVYPVTYWHFPEGVSCARCGAALPVDESYERIDGLTWGLPEPKDVVCLGCAATLPRQSR